MIKALRFLALLLAVVAHDASAATARASAPTMTTVGKTTTVGADSGPFAELIRNRDYVPRTDGGVTLQDLLRMPSNLGGVSVNYTRSADPLAVARAIASALPIAGTAVAIADLMNDLRCRLLDGVTGCDPGANQETTVVAEYQASSGGTYIKASSPSAVCSQLVAAFQASQPPQSGSWGSTSRTYSGSVTGSGPNYACPFTWIYVACGPGGTNCSTQNGGGTVQITPINTTRTECPASVDFSNPANSIPAGAAPQSDGKCKTGRYDNASAEDIAFKVRDQPKNTANNARRTAALVEALGKGVGVETDPGAVSGPASKTGSPTTRTTTSPEGVTTTTETPSWRYGYEGPTVTTEPDKETRTVNPDGSETITTESGLPPPAESPTDCEKFPNDLGCLDVGTPADEKPEWGEKTVVFEPKELGLGGFCPAPHVMSIRGIDMTLNYQPACDVAPIVRLGVLALTALGCMLWMFAAVRS